MSKQQQPEEHKPEENKSAQNNPEEHRLDFFRPNQIAFLVTHDVIPGQQLPDVNLKDWVENLGQQMNDNEQLANTSLKVFAADLCDQLNNDEQLPVTILAQWAERSLTPQLTEAKWKLAADKPIRSYTFPPVSENEAAQVPEGYHNERFNSAFSILICDVESDRFPRENIENNNKDRFSAKLGLLDLIATLDENRGGLTTAFPILTVQGVFPNWLASSSSSNSGGTGGPGGRPAPYDGDPEQIPFYFEKLISELEGANQTKTNIYGDGKGVDVVILDTAPSAHDLVLAHKELVLIPEKENKKGHPLIKKLLGPDGQLKLYPATFEEQLQMGNTSLNKHGYKMEDHGLFIAGIIHSIVPKATIHLIEVLSPWGVGDFAAIASGLSKAYAMARKNNQRLVVSCSLVLDVPKKQKDRTYRKYRPTNKELIPDSELQMEEEVSKWLNTELRQSELIGIEAMCDRLGKAGRQVVAAAGNDSEKKDGKRDAQEARYPAAFSKVVGVGAIPKNAKPDNKGQYEASSFSNLADKPAQTGIMALGGEEGENNGVLGIYLGEFPPLEDEGGRPIQGHGWAKTGPKSVNGWGWWAGTSFATPIVTGAIASVLTKSANPPTTQQALQRLYDAWIIVQKMTVQEEDGMPSSLTQVVPPLGKWD